MFSWENKVKKKYMLKINSVYFLQETIKNKIDKNKKKTMLWEKSMLDANEW